MRLDGDSIQEVCDLLETLNEFDGDHPLILQSAQVWLGGERLGHVMWLGEDRGYVFESD